ncbi:MAG TPA: PAS domain S-box protein, partial [Candidatus Bathyarchaeia archaeon]|nr:PAS domain S-box protein [Candidatus Bathyarchaeia archaeon]
MQCTDTHRYQESVDYLAGVFESFPAALVSLDTRLRIIMFNRSAEALTGFRSARIQRRRVNCVMRL